MKYANVQESEIKEFSPVFQTHTHIERHSVCKFAWQKTEGELKKLKKEKNKAKRKER